MDQRDIARFFAEPWRFDFFQAVKVLETVVQTRRRQNGEPDVVPPGSTTDPDEEPVRFRSTVAMGFPASDVAQIEVAPRDGGTPVVQVNFMGLVGPRGPLPLFYVDLIRTRRRLGDHGLGAFFDIFNHRLVSLLYRLRQRNRPTLHTGRPEDHPYAGLLLSVGGLGGPAARRTFDETRVRAGSEEHRGIRARDLILYAGLLWHRDRPMEGLERLLTRYFGRAFKGRELCGGWLRLADSERTALSVKPHHNRLGISSIAGARVPDSQSGFELSVGPMDWEAFNAFLPCGRSFVALEQLVRYYTRGAFDFYLRLGLQGSDVLPNRPGLSARTGPRLGWTSWAMTRPLQAETVSIRVPGRVVTDPLPPEN